MGEILIEIFYEMLFLGLVKIIKYLGLLIIKIVTFNSKSFKQLNEEYENSITPYLIGFVLLVGGLCWLLLSS